MPVTSPENRPGGDARHPLNRLHQRARDGEVTSEELLRACLAYLLPLAEKRQRQDPDLRDIGADGCAGEVLATVLRKDGGEGAEAGLFPGIRSLTVYLRNALNWKLNTAYTDAKKDRDGRPRPGSIDTSAWDDYDKDRYLADPRAEIDTNGIAVTAEAACARARRRAARLRAEATAGRHCPFHMLRPCPHADSVIDFLEEVLKLAGALDDADLDGLMAEKGRTLSLPVNRTGAGRRRLDGSLQAEPQQLSGHEHTLDRHFRRCFEWWRYRALAGTELDPAAARPPGLPSSRRDPLRKPVVDRLRLTRDGDWNRETCSLLGAVQLIWPEDEFRRLLFTHKLDVYHYLAGRTT